MQLSVSILGPFQVLLDGKPATFATDRARALLAYLSIEAGRPHRREVLADLLWPDRPESVARKNLSQTLLRLRRAIDDYHADPPFLNITAKTIEFAAKPGELDVARFEESIQAANNHVHPGPEKCRACEERFRRAANLYRGDFLEGLSLAGSLPLEEWAVVKREELHRHVMAALGALAAHHEARREYDKVQRYAERQLAMEPWREQAHRRLMRALAATGQRSAALAQYQTCRRILAEELSVEPAAETTALFEQIREQGATLQRPSKGAVGTWKSADSQANLPFVGRERELERLDQILARVLGMQGQPLLISGEAGSGKSALAREFARRAQNKHTELVVAHGACSTEGCASDPYHPFREMLSLLAGIIDGPLAEGTISEANGRRLASLAPLTTRILEQLGPDLLPSFTSRSPRAHRPPAEGALPPSTDGASSAKEMGPGTPQEPHADLFQQYAAVLRAVAAHQPLLLVLHGLHWAGATSANLLLHLGRHLRRSRILILATYRPEDMGPGWAGRGNPWTQVIGELKRHFGDMDIDLDTATRKEGRSFIDALLDTEPNRLDGEFRQALWELTGGHALFSVELVREMKDCGDLQLDEEGRWVEGPQLNWQRLPVRVEAVFEMRLSRLSPELRQALRVASVEGVQFTAEVVARVQGIDERRLIRLLSAQGVRQHRVLSPPSLFRQGTRLLSRYRFRHQLFQRYLYQGLDDAEWGLLHRELDAAQHALYGP